MKARSTEILHIEGEIGKQHIRILIYMHIYTKKGSDNETKTHYKKIAEKIRQMPKENEIQQ